jgi:Spy/CpxP family protein refolding chaperone
MTRTRVLIVICFAAAFAAGISGGLAVSHRGAERRDHPRLVEQLDLTPEQASQIRDIWSQTREAMRAAMAGQRDALEDERENAIRDLLTEDQVARYEQVMDDYRRKREALREQRRAIFEHAVERTKALLTDEQRAKYEGLLEERRKQGGPAWGRRRHGSSREERGGTPDAAPRGQE